MIVHTPATRSVLQDVAYERYRQDQLWGPPRQNPDRRLSILIEEVGEAAQAANDGDHNGYRAELVQVAAVAVANIEAFDAGAWDRSKPQTPIADDVAPAESEAA